MFGKHINRLHGKSTRNSSVVTQEAIALHSLSFLFLVFSFVFPRGFLACIGMRRFTKLDFNFPAGEEDSNGSEYSEVRKQPDKPKKRIKTLVNVVETRNMLLEG